MGIHALLAKASPKTYALASAVSLRVVAFLAMLARLLTGGAHRFRNADAAAANIGNVVIVLVLAILVPVIVMELLASLLPDYFSALGVLFTALDNINTTGWPGIVGTMFEFVPLVLGVVAIGAVFGLGALLVIRTRGARNA